MESEDIKKKPEEVARVIIDKQLNHAGWDVVKREEYVPGNRQVTCFTCREAGHNGNLVTYVRPTTSNHCTCPPVFADCC